MLDKSSAGGCVCGNSRGVRSKASPDSEIT